MTNGLESKIQIYNECTFFDYHCKGNQRGLSLIEPTKMTKWSSHMYGIDHHISFSKIQPCDLNYDSSIQHGVSGQLVPTKEVRTYWPLYTVRVSKPRKMACDRELITLKSIYVNV